MKQNNILEKIVEFIPVSLITSLITAAGIYTFEIERARENHYNSLSREQKIVYLENELNTTYKQPSVMFRPGMLAIWGHGKEETKRKLEELKRQ